MGEQAVQKIMGYSKPFRDGHHIIRSQGSASLTLYGIGSLLAIGGARNHALILLKRIPLRREGGWVKKNPFLAVAR
jgi:hypothetical protein